MHILLLNKHSFCTLLCNLQSWNVIIQLTLASIVYVMWVVIIIMWAVIDSATMFGMLLSETAILPSHRPLSLVGTGNKVSLPRN